MRFIIFNISFFIFLVSCKEQKEQSVIDISADGVSVEVIYGAGDSYDVDNVVKPYLPLPFNVAIMVHEDNPSLDFIILSDRIYKGQDLNVIPIGAMRLTDDGIKKDFFIAIPSSEKRQTFKAIEFSDFAELDSRAQKNEKFRFSEILAIVNPIVNFKVLVLA